MGVLKSPIELGKALATHDRVESRRIGTRVTYWCGPDRVDDQMLKQMLRDRALVAHFDPVSGTTTCVLSSARTVTFTETEVRTVPPARMTDPQTSHRNDVDVAGSLAAVLWLLSRRGDMTHDELIAAGKAEAAKQGKRTWSEQRYRSACAELVERGLATSKGQRPTGRQSRGGKPTWSTVWGLTDAGRRRAQAPFSAFAGG